MKALQLGSLIMNILLEEGLFEMRAHWHIELMDYQLAAPPALTIYTWSFYRWLAWRVETDTADEISRASMRPLG